MDKININHPTPEIGPYTQLTPFRFWCQKVLPLVYDESLSYYELLCKVVDYLNKTMEDVDQMITDMGDFRDAYTDFTDQVTGAIEELETFVNTYFDNLDVQEEVNNKLDAMAEAGYFSDLFTTLFTADIITEAGNVTSAWIAENLLQEVGYVIDNSLTVANAAADAKAVGERLRPLDKAVDDLGKFYAENYVTRNKYSEGVSYITGYVSSSDGSVTSSEGYETVIFPITEDCLWYAQIQTTFKRCAIYNSSTIGTSSFVRGILMGDIPTVSDPLFIESGLYIALSHRPQGVDKTCNLYTTTDYGYILNDDLQLTPTMEEQIANAKRPIYAFDHIPEIIGISHMGYHANAPENTLPALRLSKRKEFSFVEVDIRFTSDSIPVLMHDPTINRTCCVASNGAEISGDVRVDETTFEDLRDLYDACTPAKWSVYKGTKIPSLEEVFVLTKELGLYLFLDLKGLTDPALFTVVLNLAKNYNMLYSCIFGFSEIEGAEMAAGVDDTIYVAEYETTLVNAYISTLSGLLSGNNKMAMFAYTITDEKLNSAISAGLEVGLLATSSGETEAISGMNKKIRFVTSNTNNATTYLYDENIGDETTGLLTD